jgi:hypothetical protein
MIVAPAAGPPSLASAPPLARAPAAPAAGAAVTIALGRGIGTTDLSRSIAQDRQRVALGGTGDSVTVGGVTSATLPRLVLAGGRTVDIKV